MKRFIKSKDAEQSKGDKKDTDAQESKGDKKDKDAQQSKGDKKDKDAQESKGDKKDKDAKESKGDIKDKDAQESKGDIKDKDAKESKGDIKDKDAQESKGDKKDKDAQESKGDKKDKDAQESKGDKKDKDAQESKGDKKDKDAQESKGDKKDKDAQESKGDKKDSDSQQLKGDKKDTDVQQSKGDKKDTDTQESKGDKKDTDVQQSKGDKKDTDAQQSKEDKQGTDVQQSKGDKPVTDAQQSKGDKQGTDAEQSKGTDVQQSKEDKQATDAEESKPAKDTEKASPPIELTIEDELPEEEKIKYICSLLHQAPPGEFVDVFEDLRILVHNDNLMRNEAAHLCANHTKSNFTMVTRKGETSLVTHYNDLGGNRFFDPQTNVSFSFDHLSGRVDKFVFYSSIKRNDAELWRETLNVALESYMNEQFVSGECRVYKKNLKNTSFFVVCIESHQYEEFWNVLWKSEWLVPFSPPSTMVKGSISLQVHYFDKANLHWTVCNDVEDCIYLMDRDQFALDFEKIIKEEENKFQIDLAETLEDLSDELWRTVRRKLPVTRTVINWDKLLEEKGDNI